MRRFWSLFTLITALLLVSDPVLAQGQGKGKAGDKKPDHAQAAGAKPQQGKPQKSDQGPDKKGAAAQKQTGQKGKPDHPGSPGKAGSSGAKATGHGSFKRDVSVSNLRPNVRAFAVSKRVPERVAAGALAHAFARGVNDSDLIIDPSGNRVRIKNRKGDLLVDIDDNRARNLGAWDVRALRDNDVKDGAPSFCRSGAGHPVWGRSWCVDKGFGIGRHNDVRWGRTTGTIGDIIFGRRLVDRETLLRDALLATVGNVVLDRLGLHALTLGYTEPLSGVWVAQPTGSQVLLVNSGPQPVAELVDLDRDNRADFMVVALRPW